MKTITETRYTKQDRLADVITLISALALLQGTGFSKEQGVRDATRNDKPFSTDSWFSLVDAHPEFFRKNGDKDHVALTLRSYLPVKKDEHGKEYRDPLTVTETQKLIESAISLHDKELARFQKNAFKIPVRVAWISGSILLLASLINASVAIRLSNSSKIDSIKTTLDSVAVKLNIKP